MFGFWLLGKNLGNSLQRILAIVSIPLLINACNLIGPNFSNDNQKNQAQANDDEHQIKASLAIKSRPLDANFICFNTNILFVKSWRDRSFWQALNQLNPRMLRLPGGTESQYWDWQRGSWIEDLNSIKHPYIAKAFQKIEANRGRPESKLEEIKVGLEATNTVPLFVLNILTSDLESQLKALRQARDLGMPVNYVQIGNEPYYSLPDDRKAYPSADDYAQTARQWVAAIKREFPAAKVTVVGADPVVASRRARDSRLQSWNGSVLAQALPGADAIAIHIYRGDMLDSDINFQNGYPYFSEEDVPVILHVPFRAWENLEKSSLFQAIPRDKEIWITEYNFFPPMHGGRNRGEQKPRIIGSWVHGLYAMAMSLLFLEENRIANICNHVLLGDSSFGAILADDKFFIDPTKKATGTKFALTATGSALKLLGDATEGMNSATQINFANSPNLIGKNNFEYPALYGWQFSNNKEDSAVILNLSPQPLDVDLKQLFDGTINYRQIYGNPRDLVTGPGVLSEKQGTISQQIILPAYSVTLLSTN